MTDDRGSPLEEAPKHIRLVLESTPIATDERARWNQLFDQVAPDVREYLMRVGEAAAAGLQPPPSAEPSRPRLQVVPRRMAC